MDDELPAERDMTVAMTPVQTRLSVQSRLAPLRRGLDPVRRFAVFLMLLAGLSISGVAQAKEVKADQLKYNNHGAYVSSFYIRFNLDSGSNCKVRPKHGSHKRDHQTYSLGVTMELNAGSLNCLVGGHIRQGTEVWGYVEIGAGEKKSCRKSKKVIVSTGDGGTVHYRTGGTTKLNNNCKVSSWAS